MIDNELPCSKIKLSELLEYHFDIDEWTEMAIASISNNAFFGKRATSMVDRAGFTLSFVKNWIWDKKIEVINRIIRSIRKNDRHSQVINPFHERYPNVGR